jgi:hypothetical protein
VFQDVTLTADQPLDVRHASLSMTGGALKAAAGEAVVRGPGGEVAQAAR